MEAKINAGNTTAVTVHKELYIKKVQTCDHHKALRHTTTTRVRVHFLMLYTCMTCW